MVSVTTNQQITLKIPGLIIPEFSSFFVLSPFMIMTLPAALIYRKKHAVNS